MSLWTVLLLTQIECGCFSKYQELYVFALRQTGRSLLWTRFWDL